MSDLTPEQRMLRGGRHAGADPAALAVKVAFAKAALIAALEKIAKVTPTSKTVRILN